MRLPKDLILPRVTEFNRRRPQITEIDFSGTYYRLAMARMFSLSPAKPSPRVIEPRS